MHELSTELVKAGDTTRTVHLFYKQFRILIWKLKKINELKWFKRPSPIKISLFLFTTTIRSLPLLLVLQQKPLLLRKYLKSKSRRTLRN